MSAGSAGSAGSAACTGRRIAVIGGGWAGLAAAVEACERGHHVTLFDMAPRLGGRARSQSPAERQPGLPADLRLDNGQHILIGAYTATLGLMRRIGVAPEACLLRRPLALVDARGEGLQLRAGHPLLAFGAAVLRLKHWSIAERGALLLAASGWLARGFACAPMLSVAELTARLPQRVRLELIDPLCVAALNTPAPQASAAVFLRVLRDALFSGPGASDLLLPSRPLADLLPEPAQAWLTCHGADVRMRRRVATIAHSPHGWQVDAEAFDAVVLACSAREAARLVQPLAPAWAETALALRYEPILTAYLHAPGARLAAPMIALAEGPAAPAQFAFDHGQIGGVPGLLALVVSGAADWLARGHDVAAQALLAQAGVLCPQPPVLLQTVAERRATFACTPGLQRPSARIADGLVAAGDHVQGPYPATLEGAVRSGLQAVEALGLR